MFDFGTAVPQPLYQPAPALPRLAPPKNGFPTPTKTASSSRDARALLGSLATLVPAQSDGDYVAGLEKHLRQLEQGRVGRGLQEEQVRPSAPLLENRGDDEDDAEHDFGAGFEATGEQIEEQEEAHGEEEEEEGCCCCWG